MTIRIQDKTKLEQLKRIPKFNPHVREPIHDPWAHKPNKAVMVWDFTQDNLEVRD